MELWLRVSNVSQKNSLSNEENIKALIHTAITQYKGHSCKDGREQPGWDGREVSRLPDP